ncbi:MAG TPA: aldehyde ferredoxin oxidoreductase [Gammaproteobacteria bacterium]|nr:aldehyde ferredoxin oxidoreductase [Gammaproteobacteria bacterium]HIN18374.1 aldehyde ferredoxin oxidoreductase [Gammaproteobacteria bacterium]HIN60904.1 aldehyde ferredoxin oxidoreductase [Gammaproteobacteria bacterium]
MNIRQRVDRLCDRLHTTPQYPSQGAVVFVDLERQEIREAYLSRAMLRDFLGGRGGNMVLLYNLLEDGLDALNPGVPLIFGAGVLTGHVPGGPRGNVTSLAPDSEAILDSNAGDYFPAYLRRHGIDHLVVYGQALRWTLLKFEHGRIEFCDASRYRGMNNIELTGAIEQDFDCREGRNMALARITRAGEKQVLCSGIMAGPKSIFARGGSGAKMGSLRLKAVLVRGRPPEFPIDKSHREDNKRIGRKILSTGVAKKVLKTVGTPFLYKPSRLLGALGTYNNQKTSWHDSLDAENFDQFRDGMAGCYKCPVHCRALNRIPDADETDPYRHGDGPEYVTLGKFGPNLGIDRPEHVLRFNNILNDLGLDSASTGSAIAWAMELYQRGIISDADCSGLVPNWGDPVLIETLLFQTAEREGFGDTIADSAQAVERGKYPAEALRYRMASKGLFQSDPHDSRIIKAFALGLAVATRGMDHLRNRATLEINPRINDDPDYKRELYGATVSAEPNSYIGKEHSVARCEDQYASGDAVGMCRFNTKLFNSPSLPDSNDFAGQLTRLTGIQFSSDEVLLAGSNITALERMINYRIGLRVADDTLPQRWFDEPIDEGPFQGELIDRDEFEALKKRYYHVAGLTEHGIPGPERHERLARTVTGFSIRVELPHDLPGEAERIVVVDEAVNNVAGLRQTVCRRYPELVDRIDDELTLAVLNGRTILSGEGDAKINDGDQISFIRAIAGG